MNSLGPEIGLLGTGTTPSGLQLDISQGPLQVTNLETDMAVEGDGLFEWSGPATALPTPKPATSRSTSSGTLCTVQGYPVLDTTGHTIQPGHPYSVNSDGTIAGTGQRIALVAWPAGGATRLGENLYAAAGNVPPSSGRIARACSRAATRTWPWP